MSAQIPEIVSLTPLGTTTKFKQSILTSAMPEHRRSNTLQLEPLRVGNKTSMQHYSKNLESDQHEKIKKLLQDHKMQQKS